MSAVLPLYAVDRPHRRATVTWALIATNIAAFVSELIYTNGLDPCLESRLFYTFGLVPYALASRAQLSLQCSTSTLYQVGSSPAVYFTLLSSMFLHSGYLHIGGNTLFLFVFGGNIEARFGRSRYLASYLACGFAGGLAVFVTAQAAGPPNIYTPTIGASGAISGVMAAYLVLFPKTRIITIVGYFIVAIRAFWFIGVWFALQVLFQLGGIDTGVAYAAHIGGFTLGLVLAAIVRTTSKAREPGL